MLKIVLNLFSFVQVLFFAADFNLLNCIFVSLTLAS